MLRGHFSLIKYHVIRCSINRIVSSGVGCFVLQLTRCILHCRDSMLVVCSTIFREVSIVFQLLQKYSSFTEYKCLFSSSQEPLVEAYKQTRQSKPLTMPLSLCYRYVTHLTTFLFRVCKSVHYHIFK